MKQAALLSIAFTLAAVGCATAQSWPEWALNPPSSGELVAADCVAASGSMSVDRAQASARARLALAQQIEVKVEAMDQTWESRVREGKADKLGSSFTSASKQMVNVTLQGARATRTELVNARGGDLLCVMVALVRLVESTSVIDTSTSAIGMPAPFSV